jgi:hypothetical protein
LDQPLSEHDKLWWDQESIISDTVAMSRLILDNDYSTKYAARITEYEDGEIRVMPHDAMPYDGTQNFIPYLRNTYRMTMGRDWFDMQEASALATLLQAFWTVKGQLPDRLQQAQWKAEQSAHEQFLDAALPVMVAALEGLVSTDNRALATRQFNTRVPAIAQALGIQGVDKVFCDKMYTARSQAAHGGLVDLLRSSAAQRANIEKVALLQKVLRDTVRKAIEDSNFRGFFQDKASVQAQWPVYV